jgi:hypothetical protein
VISFGIFTLEITEDRGPEAETNAKDDDEANADDHFQYRSQVQGEGEVLVGHYEQDLGVVHVEML